MKRRSAIWLGLGTTLAIGTSRACLWDRDTLKDEAASNPEMLDLILGQFPHHGDVYYQTRVKRLSKVAEPSLDQVNDLAVAYVRLKDFTKADALLNMALKENPKNYYILSNLGVSAKKQGKFALGAKYIEQALAIKAEGHMGLGDWYLKAMRWRAENENKTEKNPPQKNFVGLDYTSVFTLKNYGLDLRRTHKKNAGELQSRFAKLIRNDQSFADGFVLVGDYLNQKGHLNLSFLSYTRAMVLGHQNPVEVRRRRRTFLKHHEAHVKKSGNRVRGVSYWKQQIAIAEGRIKRAAAWLESYKAAEAKLVKAEGDERKVSIEAVEKRLKAAGVKRVRI